MASQMNTNEVKVNLSLHELLEVMVDNSRSVKYYRTDIFRDIADITRLYWSGEKINVTWILRDSGTYLLFIDKENYNTSLETILSNYDKLKIYTINFTDNNMFTITREKNYINRSNDNDKRYTHY